MYDHSLLAPGDGTTPQRVAGQVQQPGAVTERDSKWKLPDPAQRPITLTYGSKFKFLAVLIRWFTIEYGFSSIPARILNRRLCHQPLRRVRPRAMCKVFQSKWKEIVLRLLLTKVFSRRTWPKTSGPEAMVSMALSALRILLTKINYCMVGFFRPKRYKPPAGPCWTCW